MKVWDLTKIKNTKAANKKKKKKVKVEWLYIFWYFKIRFKIDKIYNKMDKIFVEKLDLNSNGSNRLFIN